MKQSASVLKRAGIYVSWIFFLMNGISSLAQSSEGSVYGTADKQEFASAFLRTQDGGYLIAGEQKDSLDASTKFLMLKVDSSGNVEWAKTYGGAGYMHITTMIRTLDGNYVLLGELLLDFSRSYDICLMKITEGGNVLWTQLIDRNSAEAAGVYMRELEDSSLILTGSIMISTGGWNSHGVLFLVKTDSHGMVKWARSYDGGINDYLVDVLPGPSDSYYLAGRALVTTTDVRAFYMRVDSIGNVMWAKYLNTSNTRGGISELQPLNDGHFILTGLCGADGTFFMESDSNGTILNSVSPYASLGMPYIIPKQNGGYNIVGSGGTDLRILTVDSAFNTISFKSGQTLPTGNYYLRTTGLQKDDTTLSILSTSTLRNNDILLRNFNENSVTCDHDLIFTAAVPDTTAFDMMFFTQLGASNQPITLIESLVHLERNFICGDHLTGTTLVLEEPFPDLFSIHPLPARDQLYITAKAPCDIRIFTVSGELVSEQSIRAGTNSISIGTLSPGIYFMQMKDGVHTCFKKFIKI